VSEIIHGNCIEVLKRLDENSIDAIITDPPYELGFMGKSWDKSGIAFNTEVWSECLRVLKPGGHMLAFGGSRTFHRIAVAIEDAGFELRDTLMWVYGSGFPKSLDVSKAIDKLLGKEAEREVICKHPNPSHSSSVVFDNSGSKLHADDVFITAPATPEAQMWEGWGTALKPAFEPIILARKPISEKNIAENVLKWGTGGINIDDCRIPTTDNLGGGALSGSFSGSDGWDRPWRHNEEVIKQKTKEAENKVKKAQNLGRWPANFIHDGSEEVLRLFPEDNSNSAARFFYCAKASSKERGENNNHPTVKPLTLMQYLVRLVTPPNAIVLDPFAGSGSTLIAAMREGFKYIGIELNEEYIEIVEKRLQSEQPLFEYNNT